MSNNNTISNVLSSSILKEKETISGNFKQGFLTSFNGYLNHFPERTIAGAVAIVVNFQGFVCLC